MQSIRMSISCISHLEQFTGRMIDTVSRLQWPDPKLKWRKFPQSYLKEAWRRCKDASVPDWFAFILLAMFELVVIQHIIPLKICTGSARDTDNNRLTNYLSLVIIVRGVYVIYDFNLRLQSWPNCSTRWTRTAAVSNCKQSIIMSTSSMSPDDKYLASEVFERFEARLVFNKKGQHGDHFSAITATEGRNVNVIDIGVASTFFFYYIRITLMVTLKRFRRTLMNLLCTCSETRTYSGVTLDYLGMTLS